MRQIQNLSEDVIEKTATKLFADAQDDIKLQAKLGFLPLLEEIHDGSSHIQNNRQRRCRAQCAEPHADLRRREGENQKAEMTVSFQSDEPGSFHSVRRCKTCQGYTGDVFGDIPTDRIRDKTQVPHEIVELRRNK